MWFIPFVLNGIGIRSDPDGKRTKPLKKTLISAGAHGVSANTPSYYTDSNIIYLLLYSELIGSNSLPAVYFLLTMYSVYNDLVFHSSEKPFPQNHKK